MNMNHLLNKKIKVKQLPDELVRERPIYDAEGKIVVRRKYTFVKDNT